MVDSILGIVKLSYTPCTLSHELQTSSVTKGLNLARSANRSDCPGCVSCLELQGLDRHGAVPHAGIAKQQVSRYEVLVYKTWCPRLMLQDTEGFSISGQRFNLTIPAWPARSMQRYRRKPSNVLNL